MFVNSLLAERAQAVAQSVEPDVPSPCLSVCKMEAQSELCVGCFRTLDEIAAWSRMGDDDKRGVWRLIQGRAESSG